MVIVRNLVVILYEFYRPNDYYELGKQYEDIFVIKTYK